MRTFRFRVGLMSATCAVLWLTCGADLDLRALSGPEKTAGEGPGTARDEAQALRLNSLGEAYMNQARTADAEKLFAQALQADPGFVVAKANLGIALLAQQKAEAARTELAEAVEKRPDDPFAWYNLGLAYKVLGEHEKGIAAFEHVTKLAPNE